MFKELILVVCALSLVAAYPQFGGGFDQQGFGQQGFGGGFGGQSSQGGNINLQGQGAYDNTNFSPFGENQDQGEFSGSLQASGFNNQAAGGQFGGFGSGGFNNAGGW